MSIRVVNLRNYELKKDEVLIKVDRSSVLGNVYVMKSEKDRDKVCDLYEKMFDRKVGIKGSTFRNEVIRIYRMVREGKDVALGCWCYPKRCHADYIKAFIEKYLIAESAVSSDPIVNNNSTPEIRDLAQKIVGNATFKYRVMTREFNSNWQVFDDVIDEINACAIADELLELANNGNIKEVRVINNITRKCVYKASK